MSRTLIGTCDNCGNSFERTMGRGGPMPKRPYCSEACRVALYRNRSIVTKLRALDVTADKSTPADHEVAPVGPIGRCDCGAVWVRQDRLGRINRSDVCPDCAKANERLRLSKHRAYRSQRQYALARQDVFERDGWICQLCHQPIDKRVLFPDPMSPAADHIIPVSKGGTNDLTNLQAAHMGCNSKKGNRLEVAQWQDLEAQSPSDLIKFDESLAQATTGTQ